MQLQRRQRPGRRTPLSVGPTLEWVPAGGQARSFKQTPVLCDQAGREGPPVARLFTVGATAMLLLRLLQARPARETCVKKKRKSGFDFDRQSPTSVCVVPVGAAGNGMLSARVRVRKELAARHAPTRCVFPSTTPATVHPLASCACAASYSHFCFLSG